MNSRKLSCWEEEEGVLSTHTSSYAGLSICTPFNLTVTSRKGLRMPLPA